MKFRCRIISLVIGFIGWAIVPQALGQEVFYRVEGMASSADAQLAGVRLLVPWIAMSKATGQAKARVVFRNVSRNPAHAFGLMANTDYQLKIEDGGGSPAIAAKTRSEALTIVVPADGLAPTQSNSGTVSFELPADAKATGAAALLVSRFDPVGFQLVPSKRFTPPPVDRLLPVKQVLRSSHDSMSLVALEIDSVMITPDSQMVVSLAFRNTGRADLNVSTRLTGKDARLVDGELNVRAPDAVSPALQNSIVPANGILKAGTPHNGTVRFPLSHTVAGEQWQFFYPGYQRMGAQWSAEKWRFDVKVLESPTAEGATKPSSENGLAADEQRFKEINELIQKLNTLIKSGNEKGYLAALPQHLRESHGRMLRDQASVGARDLQFYVPPLQQFQPAADGVVRNVNLGLRYNVNDGSKLNEMVASALASFTKDERGWRVVDCKFVKAAPFWLLGYIDKLKTEHFTIFYRRGTESADRIVKAGRQLEKAYRSLRRKGLPVEERSVAIFLDKPEDFSTVAGMDADRFDGAAMLQYEKADNGFVVRNRVIYINDARFVTGERLWGMQDRQSTITHELVHLYLSKDTRPWIPSWVAEGIAVHFAGQHNSWSRRALRQNPFFEKLSLESLSRRHTLSEGGDDARATQAGYLLSGEAFSLLNKKGKERKLLEFYRSYAGFTFESIRSAMAANGEAIPPNVAPSIASAGPVLTNILLRQHFGTDIDRLNTEVNASVRKRGF